MTHPDEEASPFGGIDDVDGLVYVDDGPGPEMDFDALAPAHRPSVYIPPAPVAVRPGASGPGWKPELVKDPHQSVRPTPRPNLLRVLVLALVPLGLIAATAFIVLHLYGLTN